MSRPPSRRGLVKLRGTYLAPPRGAVRERIPRPDAPLTLTLHLRTRCPAPHRLQETLVDIVEGRMAPLTRAEFAAEFGASRSDIAAVRAWARGQRFRVSGVSIARRLVRITGRGSRIAAAFGCERVRFRLDGVAWNSFTGHVYLPAELAGRVLGVFGFDERPDLARTGGRDAMQAIAAPGTRSYTVPEVAALYDFPPGLDGKGQSVGVIALGGGYLPKDMRTYFRALRMPHPRIVARSVLGQRNAPYGETASFDGEITGDIQTVGAVVPRARIQVYFAPNTSRGFFEAVAQAVHEPRDANTVISISWGQAEVHWRHSVLRAFDSLLLEAAVLGITVCCSSGDFGSFADQHDRVAHVNFPGSSPHVLACGGTTLVGANGRIRSERVWHNHTGASGGGVSGFFPRPAWQERMRVPKATNGREGRGVPDVASNADPLTGYRIYGHGGWHVGAGTSASAPLWAGLVARMNQHRGAPLGLVAPALYRGFRMLRRAGALASITKGDNGLYRARRGWDCCTGVGTPRGRKLTRAIARPRRQS